MMTESEFLLDLRECIANNIRLHRHARGWTQERMADEMGVAENYIYLLENPHARNHSPSLSVLARIAYNLGIPVTDLFVQREAQPKLRGRAAELFLHRNRLLNEALNHE